MKQPHSLSIWWQQAGNHTVAISTNNNVSMNQLRQRVADWVALLADKNGSRWAVYHSDASEFLAIVLALWQLSKTAVVPGNNLSGTQADLLANGIDGFIGEFGPSSLSSSSLKNNALPSWKKIAPDFIAFEVFTSGSSGKPKIVKKTMAETQDELNALHELYAGDVDIVVATVTHQHLYGLTFRLLRPFCYQQAFSQYIQEYPEDLIHIASKYNSFSLVSSPTHLSRMNAQQDWHLIHQQCSQVLCSAAPLSRTDSIKAGQLLHTNIVEIYGSSETGAIAWRCQQTSNIEALWQPLNHVKLSSTDTGSMQIIWQSNQSTVEIADRVEFYSENTFALKGRVDQIVKIEGKRLSLTALEKAIQLHDYIDEAKALVITRKRNESAIVATLSEQGQKVISHSGKKILVKRLRTFLTNDFEASLVPKKWRFVGIMPVNTQGKLSLSTLTDLFNKTDCKWPNILSEHHSELNTELTCQLPSDLLYFDGHFSEQAILPGVVQIDWAAKYGQQYFPIKGEFTHLEVVKFQRILIPNQHFSIMLKFDPNTQKIHFTYSSSQGVHATGRLCYAE